MRKHKIAIIGYGRVGSQVASLLSTCKRTDFEVTIIDPSDWVEGSVLDTGSAFAGAGIDFRWDNDASLSQFDFIFYCAGPSVPESGDRMAVRAESLLLVENIFGGQLFLPNTFIISLSNPLDVVTHHIWKYSGLNANQVIGTGTLLDTYRMKMLIAEKLNVSVSDVTCQVLGEHGKTMVALWDGATVQGSPLTKLLSTADIEVLQEKLLNMARTIKKTQEATYFGVARSAFEIFEALIGDQEVTLPASVYLDEVAEKTLQSIPLFMSWPCTFRRGELKALPSVQLSQRELENLRLSAKTIVSNH